MLLAPILGLLIVAGAKPDAVAIYVGPNVRDGFVDVDRGVLDSIKDVQKRLRQDPVDPQKEAAFRVVDRESDATLRLYVVSRITVATGASIGVVNQGTGVTVPAEVRRLDTLLRVGSYERSFVVTGETWKGCAGDLVYDLSAWVIANRERLSGKQ